MVLASEQIQSLSLRIGGFTIQLKLARLLYREREAPDEHDL